MFNHLNRILLLSCLLASACASEGLQKGEVSTENSKKLASVLVSEGSAFDGGALSGLKSRAVPHVSQRGMVVSDDEIASLWGAEILRRGGNAVDAAVATAFALSVTRPHYASLGGGGFLVFCPAPDPKGPRTCKTIDYRENAPKLAAKDMFVRNGKFDPKLSQYGALASGVPGVTAGLLLALKQFGSMPVEKLLTKPIELAEKGFRVSSHLESVASEQFSEFNFEAKKIFGCGTDQACASGNLLIQKDLGGLLRAIAKQGALGFYSGANAAKMVKGLQAAGGIITLEDLARYSPKIREPLTGNFRGFEVVSMAPPSSGGEILLELLKYSELADGAGAFRFGINSAPAIHAISHAMALAFADRAKYLGDPDFVKIPLESLVSTPYLRARWEETYQASTARIPKVGGNPEFSPEGQNTTHFSVIDREGNAVAITTTVNNDFGSGFVPPGTGIVMNDQMDDFSAQPGSPNLFGLVGSEANAIKPGKKPLSSMAPTILRNSEGKVRFVLGAAGGPKIPTAVFLTLLNRIRFGMSLPDAVSAPRFHEQWKPESLHLEKFGFGYETKRLLSEMGYRLEESSSMARVYALERFANGRIWGAVDPRGEGYAAEE